MVARKVTILKEKPMHEADGKWRIVSLLLLGNLNAALWKSWISSSYGVKEHKKIQTNQLSWNLTESGKAECTMGGTFPWENEFSSNMAMEQGPEAETQVCCLLSYIGAGISKLPFTW